MVTLYCATSELSKIVYDRLTQIVSSIKDTKVAYNLIKNIKVRPLSALIELTNDDVVIMNEEDIEKFFSQVKF